MATRALAGSCAASSSCSSSCTALGRGGFLRKMALSYPCCQLDSSLFFFRSLLQAHNHCSIKQTLLPPMCGHEELEIVSVKELPDGFLHFSFGVPTNAVASSKVDGWSSSCGEHIAGTVVAAAAPPARRLPSKFSKKSPIPSTVQWRKAPGDNSFYQEEETSTPHSSSSSIKEVMKLTSTARPKSCFVRRSPIPVRKSEVSVLMPDNVGDKVEEAPKEGKALKRPCSKFVRQSPVPAPLSRHHVKALPSTGEVSSAEIAQETVAAKALRGFHISVGRPRSVFSRRTPIATVRRRRSLSISSEEAHTPPMNTASNKSTRSARSPPVSESLDVVDLDKCKLAELKSLAKAKGLKGYSKLKKGELLDLLKKT